MGGKRKIRELRLVVLIGLILSLLVPSGVRAGGHLATSPAVTGEVAGPQTVGGFVATVVLWGVPETPRSRLWRETRQVVRQAKRVLFNARAVTRQMPARAAEVIQWGRVRLGAMVQLTSRVITQTRERL